MIYENYKNKKIPKSRLFEMEDEVNKSIDNALSHDIEDEIYLEYSARLKSMSLSDARGDVIASMGKAKRKIMRKLYDCRSCTDIMKTSQINHPDNCINGPCGNYECTYREDFKKIYSGKGTRIDRLLKEMMKK